MDSSIYEMTLPIVGAENLIMGITLLLLCFAKRYGQVQNRQGLWFFTAAMLSISMINFAEYWCGAFENQGLRSLAVTVFAASIQLALFLFAYVSMLDKKFVTPRRIVFEIVLVVLFTTPALFISIEGCPVWFDVLFNVGILFYVVKLCLNIYTYKKYMRRVTSEVENYSSDESTTLLQWIDNTFYVILSVGVISVVIPLTNYKLLAFYNVFLFFAYLYIYAKIIRNIHLFDNTIMALKHCDLQQADYLKEVRCQGKTSEASEDIVDSGVKMPTEILEKWLSHRYYAISGITADEIALQLGTNRTKLSIYLKNELKINFYEWIAQLRIEDAKRQLIDFPDRVVYEIAVNVGIEDKSNFGRLFKRYVSVSPAVYRSEHTAKRE